MVIKKSSKHLKDKDANVAGAYSGISKQIVKSNAAKSANVCIAYIGLAAEKATEREIIAASNQTSATYEI